MSSRLRAGGSESESLKLSREHREDVSGLVGVVECTTLPCPLQEMCMFE